MRQEDTDNLRLAYERLNSSFGQTCVFHVGASAGFFSEYNTMLLAMLYCLTRRIRFTLYARDATFGFHRGWDDYFVPFCPETDDPAHHRLNQRGTGTWAEVLALARRQRSLKPLLHKLKRIGINLVALSHKRRTGIDLYTQDVWRGLTTLAPDAHYRVPELGIDGNLAHALHRLALVTWQFNDDTRQAIDQLVSTLPLPAAYAGCQVRGGDKLTEFALLQPEAYVAALDALPDAPRDVFVLTDDHRIIGRLQQLCPTRRWHSLCQADEQGYYHADYLKHGKTRLRQQTLRLLASMDVLTRAACYVGTRTSNPSIFLYLYLPGRCTDADGRPADPATAGSCLPTAATARTAHDHNPTTA